MIHSCNSCGIACSAASTKVTKLGYSSLKASLASGSAMFSLWTVRRWCKASCAAIAKFAAIRLFFLFIPAAMLNTYSWKVALGHLEVN